MIKSLGWAVSLAIAAIALAASSPAFAAIHIESCMKGTEECKPASVGTTFEATTKKFVEEAEGKIQNECEESLKAEIVDATSEKAEDWMEYDVSSVKFSNCTGGSVEAGSLPWEWATDKPTFEETGGGEFRRYLIANIFCSYILSPPVHLVWETWDYGNPSKLLDEGILKYHSGFPCWSLEAEQSVLTVTAVNDPKLTGATNLVMK
jgi:hypothetical protein